MPGRKNIWMTDEAREHLDRLAELWSLSASATIARALKAAYLRPRTNEETP